MAKNRKLMASTGFVGLTALALTMAPATAAPSNEDAEKGNELAIVYEVESIGDEVSLGEDDLNLPENVDFTTFAASVEKDDEKLSIEVVLDENDEKTGDRTVLTIEEQGVWTFETNLEGDLVKIDFVPADGFEGDPILDYLAQNNEGTEVAGTITLDYPNEEKAEEVEPLTPEELTQSDEETKDAEKVDESVVESDDRDEAAEKTQNNDEKPEAVDEEAIDETVENEEDGKSSVVKVQARTFAAAGVTLPAAPAPVAPAAPAPAEGLDPNFSVPELSAKSDGSSTVLSFGDRLPSGVDTSTVQLIIGDGADQESSISQNGKQLDVPNVGTFKVAENGSSINFQPVSGFTGTAIGHYVVQDTVGNFSNEGRLVVQVEASGNNTPDDSTSSDDANGNSPDENSNNTTEDPTVNDQDPSVANGNNDTNGNGDSATDGNGDSATDANSAARENLSNTGVDAAPVGIAAGVLSLLGLAFAAVASRLRKVEN